MESAAPRRFGKFLAWAVAIAALTLGAKFILRELESSELQARYLSSLGKELTYRLEPGLSDQIRFPATGPYDQRLGYVDLPQYVERLRKLGFAVTAQARVSPALARVFDVGLFTMYPEKTQGGLRLVDRDDQALFGVSYPTRIYSDFQEIPPIILNTLLYIENRELLDEYLRNRNPAIEWDRFAGASLDVLANKLGANTHVSGGSTLATQLEKYRHSPGGRTDSIPEKLRQVASASLRAYLKSPDTIETRQAIALAYLNTVPLAAAPGYGEVHGLGDGLWTWYGRELTEVNRLLSNEAIYATALVDTEQPLPIATLCRSFWRSVVRRIIWAVDRSPLSD
jgi:membrane peptidoglycan carboxypeptidase